MPTIKDIQSIAKNRSIQLPKKIRKANMIIYCKKKKAIALAILNKNVQIKFVYGI